MAGALAFGQARPAAAPVKAAAPKPAVAKPAAVKVAAAKPAADPNDPVVITVGDEKVTKSEFEAFIGNLPEQIKAQIATVPKIQIAKDYANLRALTAEAKRRKLDQSQEVIQQMKLQNANLLVNALFRDVEKNLPLDEAAQKDFYEKNKAQFEKVRARHILIRFKDSPVPVREGQKDLTKEEALAKATDIKKQLDGGKDFAELAKAESDDAGSGAQGGDLSSFGRGQMVPPFEQAAFALPVGKVSDPVESQFGYHIIKVEEQIGREFAGVKDQIVAKMKPEQARKAVDELKNSVKTTFDDKYFADPAAAAAAPAPPAPPKP